MKENAEELSARQLLEAAGFAVERIEESADARRADYRATKGGECFLVEVTDKKETEFFLELRRESVGKGVATGSRPVKRENTIDKIIRNKAQQLVETPNDFDCLRILWISALHEDADFVANAIRRTLYGLQDLLVIEDGEQPEARQCFYYEHNAFIRVPKLDAVVISTGEGGCLCINEFSPNAERILESELVGLFQSHAICDPRQAEIAGAAFRLDAALDRSDEKAKWRFLFEKYGARTTVFQQHEFQGVATIKPSEDDDSQSN